MSETENEEQYRKDQRVKMELDNPQKKVGKSGGLLWGLIAPQCSHHWTADFRKFSCITSVGEESPVTMSSQFPPVTFDLLLTDLSPQTPWPPPSSCPDSTTLLSRWSGCPSSCTPSETLRHTKRYYLELYGFMLFFIFTSFLGSSCYCERMLDVQPNFKRIQTELFSM